MTRPKLRRVKTPTVIQMEAVECGAAALGIILGHFGRIVPLEELRVRCGVSRDGSLASNVVKAARTFGLEAKGFKMETEGLYELELPCILFWNFNHFLVLEGFGRDKVYLNDPGEGPRTVTYEELDEGFTGVVLTMKRGPEFKPGGRKPSLIAALRRRAEGTHTALLFLFIIGLMLVIPGLVLPTFSRLFVDAFLVRGVHSWLTTLLIGISITAVIRGMLIWLQQHYLLRLETSLSIASSSKFLWHILRLPAEFYNQRYSGEISSRMEINNTVVQFISRRFTGTLISAVLVVFYGALLLLYDVPMTMIGITAIGINLWITQRVGRIRVDGQKKLLQSAGKAQGTIMGGIATIETLKASGGESDLFARWAGHQAKFVTAQQKLGLTTMLAGTATPLLSLVANTCVLTLGAYRVMEGDMTMGMLVAYQTLMASFLGPVSSLVQLSSTLQEIEGEMTRLDDVLEYPIDATAERASHDGGGKVSAAKLAGTIELRGITFGYSRLAPPLLSDFSLSLSPGARVAFVGPSGCGKSTLAKLVTGLNSPWEGDILFDRRLRSETPPSLLYNSIAFVDQDITLYEGTIRENLTLWDSTIPDAVLSNACRDAAILDMIIERPGGFESHVEEGGMNFSGGQRQRLEIARALVTNPRILVLDEATSALDALTEQFIDRRLRMRGCTCIIIAHRLSTIRDADEIVVLDRGVVMQRGTHDELIADKDGLYARLAADH